MRLKRFVIPATVLLAGCGAYLPPTIAPAPRPATEVAASFGQTWSAVVDVFAERHVPIQTIDRASGLIVPAVGMYVLSSGRDTSLADCGAYVTASNEVLLPSVADYNVRVKGDSSRSTIQVDAHYRSERGGCVTRGTWERAYETAIKARAEGRPTPLTEADRCGADSTRPEGRDMVVTVHLVDARGVCKTEECVVKNGSHYAKPTDAIQKCREDLRKPEEETRSLG